MDPVWSSRGLNFSVFLRGVRLAAQKPTLARVRLALLSIALVACSSSYGSTETPDLSPPVVSTTTPTTPAPNAPPTPMPPPTPSGPEHLRYLAINIGNVSIDCRDYEYKLCAHDTGERIRSYIATWKPDVVMLSEVLDEPQLDRVLHDSDIRAGGNPQSDLGGPVLPPELGYDHVCHASVSRDDNQAHDIHPFDTPNTSHRHECVAWRRDRLSLVREKHVFGPVLSKCNYDFTMQAATLKLGTHEVTGIAVHPASDSEDVICRTDTIRRMWKELANEPNVFVGGDWNTPNEAELQVPSGFVTNYSHGSHFGVQHENEYTAWYYLRGGLSLDHVFSNFGKPCTDCGIFYGGSLQNLPFGSALGAFDGHPWASEPGLDHHQLLVDLTF